MASQQEGLAKTLYALPNQGSYSVPPSHISPRSTTEVGAKTKPPYWQCTVQTHHRLLSVYLHACTCIQIDQYKTQYSLRSISIIHRARRWSKNPIFFLCTHSVVKLYISLHISFSPPETGPGIPFLCHSPFHITWEGNSRGGKEYAKTGTCTPPNMW